MKPMVEGVCEDQNSMKLTSSEKIAMIPVNKLCGTIHTVSIIYFLKLWFYTAT